jgi:hypothetical protein
MASQTVKNALATGGPPPHKVTVLPPLPTHAEAILLPMQRCRLAARRAAAATLPALLPGCHRRRHAAAIAAAIAALLPPPLLRCHRHCTPTLSSYSSLSPSLSSLPLPPPIFKLIVDYCLSPAITGRRRRRHRHPSFSLLLPLLSSSPFLSPLPPPLLVDCCLLSFPLPLLSPLASSSPPRWRPRCHRRRCHRNATKKNYGNFWLKQDTGIYFPV